MKLRDLLGCDFPIVQAPMAGSDSAKMIAAACNAGVLGSLGAQYRTPEQITGEIRKIRTLTKKPFAVNLFASQPGAPPSEEEIATALTPLRQYYARFDVQQPLVEDVLTPIDPDLQLQAVLDERVPVFTFTLGIPSPKWITKLQGEGTIVIGTATNLKEAIALQKAGVDAIVAQGCEAGGHRGTFIGRVEESMIGLMSLIPQMVDAVKIPVIAAGGIMDGRGIAAAMALGASGVQLGTAFLATTECPVHENNKDALRVTEADDTTITRVFSGGAARGVLNKYVEQQTGEPQLPFPYQNSITKPFRKVANEGGNIDYTNLWCGQSAKLARKTDTATLIRELLQETRNVAAILQNRTRTEMP